MVFYISSLFSLSFNYNILREGSSFLTQSDLISALMDFKRHNKHMKKNQEEIDIFRLNEWVKKHVGEKKWKEQITLAPPNFIQSVVGRLALECWQPSKPRGLVGLGGVGKASQCPRPLSRRKIFIHVLLPHT